MLESKSRTGARQTKGIPILNGNFLCLSCPSATFGLQHGSFVLREWLAAELQRAYWYLLKTESLDNAILAF